MDISIIRLDFMDTSGNNDRYFDKKFDETKIDKNSWKCL